jgi:hypothetical protein
MCVYCGRFLVSGAATASGEQQHDDQEQDRWTAGDAVW